MEMKTQTITREGKKLDIVYKEGNRDVELNGVVLNGVSGHCFCGDKLVIVRDKNNTWGFPGGAVEKGETLEEATAREVKEESNMKVLHQEYIGYQILKFESGKTIFHASSFCVVEPYGDFVSDPDRDVTEIKLIDPKDFKQYIHWSDAGDRIMERAMKMKEKITQLSFS
ncbi:MAG: NUDIX domain-containing protein [bacterium]